MHKSAYDHMALCIEKYLPGDRHYRVLDLGARQAPDEKLTYRRLLARHDVQYVGVDVQNGHNVDVVMTRPYSIPAPSRSVDVLLAGQILAHVPFFWATMLEIARVLRPDGYAFVSAPSRGHVHGVPDCWRFYPDGLRAMAAHARLRLVEAYTDFPPASGNRHDFGAIDPGRSYWGDSIGVFQKPVRYPRARAAAVRAVTRWWANRVGSLDSTPQPEPSPERAAVAGPPG